MLKTDKLNRILRILSAKSGTQVPKFGDAAAAPGVLNSGTLPKTWEEFEALYRKNGQLPPITKEEWEAKLAETVATASAEQQVANTILLNQTPSLPEVVITPTPISVEGSTTLNGTPSTGKDPEHLSGGSYTPNIQSEDDLGTDSNDPGFLRTSPKKDVVSKSDKLSSKDVAAGAKNIMGNISNVLDIADNLIDKSNFANDDPTQGKGRQAYDQVANTLSSLGPYGQVASAAMKTLGFVNDIAGSKSRDMHVDTDVLESLGGSYGGSTYDIMDASSKAGKKYGLVAAGARKRANKQILEAQRTLSRMAAISKNAADSAASATTLQQLALAYDLNMSGGYDQRYMRAAKDGTKIQYFKEPFKVKLNDSKEFSISLTDIPTVFKNGGTLLDLLDIKHTFIVNLTNPSELQSFKEGGTIKDREIEVIEINTTLKSVIPEGALHKNKHHLDEVGIDDSELTKKGIPVVDNEGDLQAEIELNEIIFTLEVTKELESRYKEFYEEGTKSDRKDELAIEAGKLLWKEILYNTDDRTGLIDTLKLGGVLKAQEGIEVPDALRVNRPLIEERLPINDSKKFGEFLKSLPDNQRKYSEDTYRMHRYWELNGKPKNFEEAIKKGMFTLENDGFYHARSVAYNPELDEYEFMKMPGHKTVWMEEEGWYNGMDFKPKEGLTEEQADDIKDNYILTPKKGRDAEESRRFREQYILDKSGKFWKYIPRNKKVKKELLGGVITQDEINQMVKQALLNLIQ